jgi:hypothetical protein
MWTGGFWRLAVKNICAVEEITGLSALRSKSTPERTTVIKHGFDPKWLGA